MYTLDLTDRLWFVASTLAVLVLVRIVVALEIRKRK